jgi:predicted RNA methylase
MLKDSIRNKAYEEAINLLVKDAIVADVGAGSGILTILAARAGASHVYAIEFSDYIEKARENVI